MARRITVGFGQKYLLGSLIDDAHKSCIGVQITIWHGQALVLLSAAAYCNIRSLDSSLQVVNCE